MKFHIITLGCKVNAYESEIMYEKLLEAGYISALEEDSDIIIIHTCSVTNMADSKSRKMIRKARREHPNGILVVCGCSAQNHQEALASLGIDILIGNKDKSNIVELLEEFQNTRKPIIRFYEGKNLPFEDMSIVKFHNHTRAFLKIQDGCNNYCSYCIIPYLRGNLRSKDFDQTIKEARDLVSSNHKEIVLTGIHTGTYGYGTEHDLVDLIWELSKIEGLHQIRISSIEITELKEKFLNLLARNDKVCNHLHIPLQAGSNHILSRMNRKYDLAYFEKEIERIRSIRSDISISTDVIVGFPGETEKDFEETLAFCKKMEFSKIHVFPYSVRKGTKAEGMEGHITEDEKKARARKLIALSTKLEEDYANKFIGTTLPVLVEEEKNGRMIGHTSNYLEVEILEDVPKNTFVNVTMLSTCQGIMKGTLHKKENKDIMKVGE